MRSVVRKISTPYLATYVAVVDATVWLAALPFEFYCKTLVAGGRLSTVVMLVLLLANLVILALMSSSVLATGELMRRGAIRMGRLPQLLLRRPAPAFVRVRSKRSGY